MSRTTHIEWATRALQYLLYVITFAFAPGPNVFADAPVATARGRAPASTLVPVPGSSAPRAAVRTSNAQLPTAPVDAARGEWLTGTWGGRRDALEARGFTQAVIVKYDAGRNVAGGARVGAFGLANVDVRMSLDTAAAGWWSGGRAFVYYLVNDGQSPADFVGDIQYTDNVDAGALYVGRLFEGWYQHSFWGDRLSLLIGLRDMNADFYVTESSLPFLNSSFGLGSEVGLSGAGGPSTFPVTAPSVRLRYEPTPTVYAALGVHGAVAGHPPNPNGTHLRFNGDDGHLVLAEVGHHRRESGQPQSKLGLGGWAFTNPVRHLNGARGAHAFGAYLMIDREVGPSTAVFARLGVANPAGTLISANAAAGILTKGVRRRRGDDLIGLAVTSVRSGKLLAYGEPRLPTAYETAVEVFYRLRITRGVHLQPDVQWVADPYFDGRQANSTSFIVRAEVNL